jgi:hypothetical protein
MYSRCMGHVHENEVSIQPEACALQARPGCCGLRTLKGYRDRSGMGRFCAIHAFTY